MTERYLVTADGQDLIDGEAARPEALRAALAHLDRALPQRQVAIADARTLQVCALWERRGAANGYRLVGALQGWL